MAARSPSSTAPLTDARQEERVKKHVRRTYGELAESPAEACCCPVTEMAGYSEAQLEAIPESARAIAAGCGNPTALAQLRPGEVVLDLGSGGGIDVLLAAKLVGPSGRAIGVDMTPEMVAKARENAAKMGAVNVEFKLGEIEQLPIPDESIDVVISNCVINLSPDKPKVFKEAYRVLRKGGRMLVSDIMVQGLPEALKESPAARAACIGGAISLEEYMDAIRTAGFTQIKVVSQQAYPREMAGNLAESLLWQECCGPTEPQATCCGSTEPEATQSTSAYTSGLRIMHAEIEAWK